MNVILHIKARSAEAILEERKRFEFRNTRFRRPGIERIYLYVTAPLKKIVGEFTIKSLVQGHPKEIWETLKQQPGISEGEFWGYFGTSERGVAIEVGIIRRYKRPIDPREQIPGFKPPQSFCYLEEPLTESE
jgi:type I restriction enzyme S subunit